MTVSLAVLDHTGAAQCEFSFKTGPRHSAKDVLLFCRPRSVTLSTCLIVNASGSRGNYSATSNNMKLVHRPLMGGLLHLHGAINKTGDATPIGQRGKRHVRPNRMRAHSRSTY